MKNSILERALRITYKDGTLRTFQELVHKENSDSFFFFLNLFQ